MGRADSDVGLVSHWSTEAEDDRFVAIEQADYQLDWIRGATGGRDHWALADNFIAATRQAARQILLLDFG
ncbi:hypothetical protein DFH06DRAFT_1343674 [Mycena polygramma]|nr:hypothetical protein DFH06DRAFT_1343674 [Mycena polygramma]